MIYTRHYFTLVLVCSMAQFCFVSNFAFMSSLGASSPTQNLLHRLYQRMIVFALLFVLIYQKDKDCLDSSRKRKEEFQRSACPLVSLAGLACLSNLILGRLSTIQITSAHFPPFWSYIRTYKKTIHHSQITTATTYSDQ